MTYLGFLQPGEKGGEGGGGLAEQRERSSQRGNDGVGLEENWWKLAKVRESNKCCTY